MALVLATPLISAIKVVLRFPVRQSVGGDEEMVDRANIFRLLQVCHSIKLSSTKLKSLLLFAGGRREDHYLTAHLGRELDGQMTQAANAQDTYSVVSLDVVGVKGIEDSSAGTHERGRFFAGEVLRDQEQERLKPDCMGGERALVEAVGAVDMALGTVVLASSKTLVAVATGIMLKAPSDTITTIIPVSQDLIR